MSAAPTVYRPDSVAQAIAVLHEQPDTRPVGGGTELVALLRGGIVAPSPLLMVKTLGLDTVVARDDHLVLGAGARMADVARSPLVLQHAPAVAQALLASASPQVRNVATLGGNLLQRTRCPYFRGSAGPCNKRMAGAGCGVQTGEQRHAAVFGTSERCCATHASDLAVALLALDAELSIHGPRGERRMPLAALYLDPADDPMREHALAPGELITAIALPLSDAARRSRYLKVRDRASFQFAVVSVALALTCHAGRVAHVRLAAGGVGTRPWRLHESEAALIGHPLNASAATAAAAAATAGATPLPGNTFKLELLQRCVAHLLHDMGAPS